ncbi:MAG: orotidine-5'-phosphate decarboxylase [Fimbriimonadaceae bacterium]
MIRKIICALDTGSLDEALRVTRRLADHVGAFKIGHALTLPHGLDVVKRIQDAGASRIFLDLKFHDIPTSVALAVCEAAKCGVWMLTLHISGGPAMIEAAVEEAASCGEEDAPILLGVSVLTSLDQHVLTDHLGVQRSIKDHMTYLSRLGIDCGLDGVVCSPHEVGAIRREIGHAGIIVTPGIRASQSDMHDQQRVGDARAALADGADYLVVGRALTEHPDPEEALQALGFPGVKLL